MEPLLLLTYLALCVLSVAVPGPNLLLSLRAQLVAGREAADAAIAGICVAKTLWGGVVVVGIAATFERAPMLFLTMKVAGAVYVCWLGLGLLARGLDETFERGTDADATPRSVRRFFGEGVVTAALNPNTFLFYLALFPQFLGGSGTMTGSAPLLVAVNIGVNAAWFTLVVRAFERVGTRVIGGGVRRWTARGLGCGLMGFGLLFLVRI